MNILSIETSCDETAIAYIVVNDNKVEVVAHELYSQSIDHNKFGGVYPALAKREHIKNLPTLLDAVLQKIPLTNTASVCNAQYDNVFTRMEEMRAPTKKILETHNVPLVDVICVTTNPGLEIALWTGITFAKALSHAWRIPTQGVNHLEGHIISALYHNNQLEVPSFPLTSLIISGGHTEFVTTNDLHTYNVLGTTKDDAVGETFDKVARMLSLPYPGGPHISNIAHKGREENIEDIYNFPRPMTQTDTLDMSFSGLKTAVMYTIKKISLDENTIKGIALAFENAITDTLIKKIQFLFKSNQPKTFILTGGVSANEHITSAVKKIAHQKDVALYIPQKKYATDNAVMIAMAGSKRYDSKCRYTIDSTNTLSASSISNHK